MSFEEWVKASGLEDFPYQETLWSAWVASAQSLLEFNLRQIQKEQMEYADSIDYEDIQKERDSYRAIKKEDQGQ